jgi:Zn-dependent protease
MTCACGTEVADALLACPSCHRLVHADYLKGLAAAAEAAARRGDPVEEIANWRRALDLLPPGSRQAAQVGAKVEALSARAATPFPPASPGSLGSPFPGAPGSPADGAAGAAAAGAGGEAAAAERRRVWGARGALATGLTFLATKAKLLLLGLTKASTLFSMLLSVGVSWTVFGWRFAVLLVLSIYVHEMGHVAALRRFGIQATAPMFVPGLGALIRLRQHPANPREDARIGLAGPLWGCGAAAAAYLGFALGGGPLWAAVARFGAWVNLFNLLPVWQLDGGRAFRALSRQQRLLAVAALAALWALSHEGLLVLLLIAAAAQAFRRDAPEQPDHVALGEYVFLAAVLTLLCLLHVPLAASR